MNANDLIKISQHTVIARHIQMQQGEHDVRHRHPWHQLILAKTGVLRTRAGLKEYFIPYNRAALIPAGQEHESWAVTPVEFLGVYLNPSKITLRKDECSILELSSLFRELIYLWVADVSPLETPSAQETRLSDVIFDLTQSQKEVNFELALPRDPRANLIAEKLLAEPSCDFSLKRWAECSGASERTIERIFTNETGLSFSKWRQRLRLYHSLSMLEQNHPVKTVALNIGYQSASAFIHRFKTEFGLTPNQYSSSLRRQPNAINPPVFQSSN